jgi:hypothetical protein
MDKKKNKKINMSQQLKHLEIDGKTYQLKIFEIKKFFILSVHPYIRLTPFELVDLIFSVNIKTITVNGRDSKGKEVKC